MATERRVTLRQNGQLTLPAELRERVHAKPGDVFVAEVTADDDIVLRRRRLVDAGQAYFWTETWQRGEREAQADIRAGRTKKFKSAKDLIADLER
jgi:AbrB family looped-hinge helix DNA binding protein